MITELLSKLYKPLKILKHDKSFFLAISAFDVTQIRLNPTKNKQICSKKYEKGAIN